MRAAGRDSIEAHHRARSSGLAPSCVQRVFVLCMCVCRVLCVFAFVSACV